MKIRRSKYTFDISEDDIRSIRQILRNFGKSEEVITAFNVLKLQEYYEAWEIFVNTDWGNWDVSEYNHDSGCRYFIQLAIENSSPKTRKSLEQFVKPIDDIFRKDMQPLTEAKLFRYFVPNVFDKETYFWEENSLHPYHLEY